MESKLPNRLSLYVDSQSTNKSNQKELKIMKTKFYWVALLASAAMIAQANAGGRYAGGGGRTFAMPAAPARAAAPSFNSAPSRSFGSGRMVYSVQRFPQTTLRSPSSPEVRQNYINANAGTRQFARTNINRADRPARFSNEGNRAITNVQRQGNGSELSRNGNNLRSNWRDHVVARHSADWHRDWDRRHGHFHHGHVFVFIDGFWWGLDPGFYPYYAYDNYPYDDNGYANNAYPYDYYDYSAYNYGDEQGYAPSDQDANNVTVSAVQSKLAKLGYYRGVIDGVDGDQMQAALARYQEDQDLSVTGTLTAATLQSLGIRRTAS
jgi:putative peptidoglycan binding protein